VPATRTHAALAPIGAGLIGAALLAAAAALPGCSPGQGAESRPAAARGAAGGAARAAATDSVELNAGQLQALRIAPVGTHCFAVDRQAVGSVSFEEDPAIVQAESTLVGAAAIYDLTRKELARVAGLGESNGIAAKELEQAQSDEQTAAAALRAARDAVRALGKSEAQIEAMVRSGRIESPAAGRAKWVRAAVAENDSPYVHAGQPVAVHVSALRDRVYAGTVVRVYSTVDPDTHRVTVRVRLAAAGDELRPGMLAEVAIRTAAPVESLAVPTTAVVREGDGSMIAWVTGDRRHFVERALKLGLQSDDRYQVLAGLNRGELVVTEGGVFLSNMLHAPPSD
jgi:membrane fusion protein, heavy metal efflux system